ncbi:hypothetical protein Bbelb_026110 [Branchiostoma belcheri]|nr:hypothetical protein Bbelb_026110 [Branchiostoma belcheri]
MAANTAQSRAAIVGVHLPADHGWNISQETDSTGERSYVVSTYNALTTCTTYDARNRSRPDVACRPHSYTLRDRPSDVRVTCVDATPSPRFQKIVANVTSQKTYEQKARTAGCDRGFKDHRLCLAKECVMSQLEFQASFTASGGTTSAFGRDTLGGGYQQAVQDQRVVWRSGSVRDSELRVPGSSPDMPPIL